MRSRSSIAFLVIVAATLPAMATDNGPGPHGSNQRKAYCANQLLDCQDAVDENCQKKGDKAGPYCLADGQAVCNTMHDRCIAKLVVVGPKAPAATGQLPKQKAH